MIILGIDPGDKQSAYTLFDTRTYTPLAKEKMVNSKLVATLSDWCALSAFDALAIEYPRPRGQPMYYQLVDTIFWIGRFAQINDGRFEPVDRKDVKMHLVGSTRADDSNVRMACINKFKGREPIGKGKVPEIGIKSAPGVLYGFASDTWSALAVCLYYADVVLKARVEQEAQDQVHRGG